MRVNRWTLAIVLVGSACGAARPPTRPAVAEEDPIADAAAGSGGGTTPVAQDAVTREDTTTPPPAVDVRPAPDLAAAATADGGSFATPRPGFTPASLPHLALWLDAGKDVTA